MKIESENLEQLQKAVSSLSSERWIACVYETMVGDVYRVSTVLCDLCNSFIAVHVLETYDFKSGRRKSALAERDMVINAEDAVLLVNDSLSAVREEIDAVLKEHEKKCSRPLELLEELGSIVWDYPVEQCLNYGKVTALMTEYAGVGYAIKTLHDIYFRHNVLRLEKGDDGELAHRLCVAESVIHTLKIGQMTLDRHVTIQLSQIASVQFLKVSNKDVCIIEMSNGSKYDVYFSTHPNCFEQLKYLFD